MSSNTSFPEVKGLNDRSQEVLVPHLKHPLKGPMLTAFSQTSETQPSELVVVVDDLLNQLSSKFSNLSSELIGKSKSRAAITSLHRAAQLDGQ